MGKLVIDGNKVYTVDEDCLRRKNLTLSQIRQNDTDSRTQQRQERRQKQERRF